MAAITYRNASCIYEGSDKLAVDFGGGFQTGIHVSVVYQLRQALGLDRPGTPVKVVEPYQMLGEVAPDSWRVLAPRVGEGVEQLH